MPAHFEFADQAEDARTREQWREAGMAYLLAADAAPDPETAAQYLEDACFMHDMAQYVEAQPMAEIARR